MSEQKVYEKERELWEEAKRIERDEKIDDDLDFESQREAFHDTRRADFEREVYRRIDREEFESGERS